ncbi:MAG TPA: carbon monoxide dehydrogenase subunit G [Micromonosporaceae bacterium]|jgi:hypothetical protein|nr:carbon monoxide dehydrogenase subunit G [Micromonosporaceae bacterium]
MKLSGDATLHAPVSEVYAALNDPALLVRTIPGCQRLEQTGPDAYRMTVHAGVASIKGTFVGDVRLTDQDEPHAFLLRANGAGAPGTVDATAAVTLADAGNGATLLRYDAQATVGGVIGGVGQRVLAGVARKTATEFFAAVDAALAGESLPEVPVSPIPAPGAAALAPTAAPAATPATGVWTAPAPTPTPALRGRDVLIGAIFGAAVALLGVLVGVLVAG